MCKKKYDISELVAEHFVDGKSVVNCYVIHVDEDFKNNDYRNLKWVDKETHRMYTNNRKHIMCYDKDGVLLKEYPSVTFASKATEVSTTVILNCCKGKTKLSRSKDRTVYNGSLAKMNEN